MVLKIIIYIKSHMKTIKKFRYWSSDPIYKKSKLQVVAMCQNNKKYNTKKFDITRVALQQIYDSPSLREPKKITLRQARLKMILNEALDIAYYICEHGDTMECLLAWEVVDEIDDAATRAGVTYN
jgi:hypothetical protein